MHVLHLCSDYARQALYRELVTHLDELGVLQSGYVPVRTKGEVGRYDVRDREGVSIQYSPILRRWHRVLFRAKVRAVLRDVEATVDIGNVDLLHAHFLYSDGVVALTLADRHDLPFIVAVRNTDLNFFMRFRPDLCLLAQQVLKRASRVVFLSPAYRAALLRRLPSGLQATVAAKSRVVPNGIGPDWVSDSPSLEATRPSTLRLLYVGDFSENKNVRRLVQVTRELGRLRDVTLTLVGGGGRGESALRREAERHEEGGIRIVGRVEDPVLLRGIYRAHDIFVMPSHRETFGLAYIEALSQGLPVVHSRGQGIDGFFQDGGVSQAVNPRDSTSIAAGILELAERMSDVREQCISAAKRFAWPGLADEYKEEYRSILRA